MHRIKALAAAVAIILAPGFAAAQEVRVGYWASGVSAGLGFVLEDGKFLEKEGLKPSWVQFTKLAEVNRALISKSIDIAVAGGTVPSLRLGAEGVPAKIIASDIVADANFVVPEDSPIKTLADLKGKRIGSTPPGSTAYALVATILKRNYGMTDKDFQQVPSGEAQLLTFMQRGEIQAALMRTITLRQLGPAAKVRVIGTVPQEWKKLIKADSPPVLGVAVVDSAFNEKNPEVTVKFMLALMKAVKWGAAHQADVAAILKTRLNMNDAEATAYASAWTSNYFASLEEADIQSLLQMAEVFKAEDNFPGTVTRDVFLPEPYQKAKALMGSAK
ncbi:ABC transporter substrate-binding protein [Aquabacter spiritensis]|uniref:NitT/TauT family transport system substrate-binding protein n=1 Tax=Aquabacter spiritensis TaxID=933073 RepID=A0A4R3LV19_9HYPH|nr:ABC transporter substrate-binding protein [Aquabacter spiritensis]TCT04384.1 NitT/TauT family transport system substrate-binding protein [Aquabacter spiritensis]